MVYIIKHGEFEVSKKITVKEEKQMSLNMTTNDDLDNNSLDQHIMGSKKAGGSFRKY